MQLQGHLSDGFTEDKSNQTSLTWHMAKERPEKRHRLTPNDCESKVLGSGEYSGVLPDDEVPFVNRHSELFDLFHANAAVTVFSNCSIVGLAKNTLIIGGPAAWR